jgi:hypothetical protein
LTKSGPLMPIRIKMENWFPVLPGTYLIPTSVTPNRFALSPVLGSTDPRKQVRAFAFSRSTPAGESVLEETSIQGEIITLSESAIPVNRGVGPAEWKDNPKVQGVTGDEDI